MVLSKSGEMISFVSQFCVTFPMIVFQAFFSFPPQMGLTQVRAEFDDTMACSLQEGRRCHQFE